MKIQFESNLNYQNSAISSLLNIVEGFTTMKTDLETEKRSMARIWKQRDKQIDKVLENTTGMYGSIKGIAGNAIGNVKALELPYSDVEDDK
ncbi:MAG: hypothetical protein DRG11_01105 [Epsilonproteobacteria bacterium]|nr:MAG: hypothetical protein DRG11_01105 [Campylobacterota bacterium]